MLTDSLESTFGIATLATLVAEADTPWGGVAYRVARDERGRAIAIAAAFTHDDYIRVVEHLLQPRRDLPLVNFGTISLRDAVRACLEGDGAGYYDRIGHSGHRTAVVLAATAPELIERVEQLVGLK